MLDALHTMIMNKANACVYCVVALRFCAVSARSLRYPEPPGYFGYLSLQVSAVRKHNFPKYPVPKTSHVQVSELVPCIHVPPGLISSVAS